MNHNPTFCMLTPSYAPDLQRCELLCRSIDKFISPLVTHYIIVDGQDYKLFKHLEGSHTEVLVKEEILPWWIRRIPFLQQNIWLSLRSAPLRGWLIQQIIKIGIAHQVKEDILVFVDSDVVFIRKFDFQNLTKDGKVRFYMKPSCIPVDMKQGHDKWYRTASNILNVPLVDFPAPDYINQVVTWRRDNVVKMCELLEVNHHRSWIEVLSSCQALSEYILYGTFVDHILGDSSGHYYESWDICYNHYDEKPLSAGEIEQLFATIPDHMIAVMLSAKAQMPTSLYTKYLDL